ncbi:MAG: iron ABC transporter permease [Bacteroidota bacterium]
MLLLGLTVVLGLQTGSFDYSFTDILQALTAEDAPGRMVVLELRLPRIVLAFCTGAILALSGFFMQALIKNPLADPYIMGLTAGAGFGVNLVILGIIPLAGVSIYSFPLFASIGGSLSLLFVIGLGFRAFMEDNAKLLIAGVAVSSLFTAITGVMIYTLADSDQVRRLVFWTFGSLSRSGWEGVWVSLTLLCIALIYGILNARRLDILQMGDQQAQSLGLRVGRMKIYLLLITSLVVGGCVAFTGPIGFVGMMIPHFSRSLWGSGHRQNIVLGSLLGGFFLLACDVLSRWVLPPAGLPIGIMTAILGVPFFLYVLFSRKSYL